MSESRELALSFLRKKAEADVQKARLSFSLLLDAAVGIGDHSTGDFHNNLEETLNLLVDAEDRLECLDRNFPQRPTPIPEYPYPDYEEEDFYEDEEGSYSN